MSMKKTTSKTKIIFFCSMYDFFFLDLKDFENGFPFQFQFRFELFFLFFVVVFFTLFQCVSLSIEV